VPTRLLVVLALLLPRSLVAQDAVGINAHLPSAAELDLAAEMGVQWVRMDANWFQLEPRAGEHAWSILDGAVDGAGARGLRVYLTLAYTPAWVPKVERDRSDDYTGNDEPSGSAEWVRFVEAAVRHFRARGVTHFGMWNEANLESFWDGSIEAYVDKIAIPGAAAVRRVCDDCVVLGPELAHVGDADEMLDRVMARAGDAFDVVAHHLYNGWPETGTSVVDGDNFLQALEMRRFGFTRASLREVLDRHGWTGEVWITETGYRVEPVGSERERERQAVYVRRVLEEQLARDWWTNSFFYELVDCGVDQPDCPIDGYGLTRPTRGHPRTSADDYATKPAFAAIRRFVDAHPELGTGALACVDGDDNDGDGRVDGDDRGCSGRGDGDESDDPPRLRVEAVQLEQAPRLDGIASEWGGARWVPIEGWRGAAPPGDVSARVAVGHVGGKLYVVVTVMDDVHVNEEPATTLWAADSVQLAFDVGRDFGVGYDDDDHELDVALARGETRTHRNRGDAEIEAAVRRDGPLTTYELALGSLGAPLTAGRVLGFSALVNERDGAAREGWLELTPGIGDVKEPYWFAELELLAAGAPRTPDAGADPEPPPRVDGGAIDDVDAGVEAGRDESASGCQTAPSGGFAGPLLLVLFVRRRFMASRRAAD